MARGPFQGTWQAGVRPTVTTAPDALVYINGDTSILACGQCRRRFDLNKYITSIQVDLSVDNAPGSASINLSIPRHTVDDFFFEGEPIISPMMEVEIFAKGYFLVEGLPQYYPIFWGLVTDVGDSFSGGEHTVSINCADILKWWELCRMNVNPAFTQAAGALGRNYITGNVFHGSNVYDVIWTLAQQSFGDIVYATGSLTSLIKEQRQKDTFGRALGDIMGYWNQRFGQIRSNLLLYGTQGTAVRGDVLYEAQPTGKGPGVSNFAAKAVRLANGGDNTSQLLFDPESVQPFRSQLSNAGSPALWQSEFQTKLEIANACKEAVGFEFYMDVTGDIVFKPPFYNLDVLSNKPVSWIQDIDIIDWNFSESESEVVTHLQVQGSFEGGAMDMGVTSDFNTPYTQVIDYHLLRRYGWRSQSFNAEYLNTPFDMFWTGVDMLDRMNARRHRASITIPFRPELRLGFPIYVAPKDQVWYIQGISHSITFGGRAQTTLTLTAKRGKFIAPRGIGEISLEGFTNANRTPSSTLTTPNRPTTTQLSKTGAFKMKVGDAAEIPISQLDNTTSDGGPYAPLVLRHPKTGRIVGYPNVVMAYTRPYQPDEATLAKALGQNVTDKRKGKKIRKTEGGTAKKQAQQQVAVNITQTEDRALADKHLNNRYTFGLTSAGVYTYVHDLSKVIQELVLLPAKNITLEGTDDASQRLGTTAIIRPVSDERGFELVGQFRYGRGVSLRDGSLVLSDLGRSTNQRAAVSTQLALSGGLFESLSAQSAGLTSISSSYANPADVISRLAPEDLQTAATLNPETKEPEFDTTGTNFIDVAPLNSPQNKGIAANVEASQLSNGLTLAEMRPTDEAASESVCSCLMGRSDLAFINVGYQVQFLTGTAPDDSDQATAPEGTGNNRTGTLTVGGFIEDLGGPVASEVYAPNADVVQSRVEQFLADLYTALDTPHQEFEKGLRGGFFKLPTREAALNPEPAPPKQPLSPPFSAIGRAQGGDPEALALQGNAAVEGMASAWKRFGEGLQAGPKRTTLETEIRRLERKIQDLTQEEILLQKVVQSGSVSVSPSGNQTRRLANIPAEREAAERSLEKARTDLRTLNNEFPP